MTEFPRGGITTVLCSWTVNDQIRESWIKSADSVDTVRPRNNPAFAVHVAAIWIVNAIH